MFSKVPVCNTTKTLGYQEFREVDTTTSSNSHHFNRRPLPTVAHRREYPALNPQNPTGRSTKDQQNKNIRNRQQTTNQEQESTTQFGSILPLKLECKDIDYMDQGCSKTDSFTRI